MQKGAKTSEFYVVLAVLASGIAQQFGVDLSSIAANPDDISGMIKAAQSQGGNASIWIALAYVVGRVILKVKDK
jgi:hypothetical protein